MKTRWPFFLVLAVLVAAGLTFHLWFPPLMNFVGANAEVIQGAASLIQIVIWVGSAVLVWFGFLCKKKENPKLLAQPKAGKSSARLEGDGAIAQGNGAVAVGKSGVYVGGQHYRGRE